MHATIAILFLDSVFGAEFAECSEEIPGPIQHAPMVFIDACALQCVGTSKPPNSVVENILSGKAELGWYHRRVKGPTATAPPSGERAAAAKGTKQ